jgi:hypothetical protein
LGSLHTKSDQLSPVIEGDEQQGFTIDKKHEEESKDDTDRTVIPRDASLRHGRIITEGFLSPSKPMFRKYSESQHPLLQLFNNEESQDNISDSSPTGSYRNPTITIPPVNINLMPHMEDSPSRTITRAHFQSNYLVPKTKDSNSDSGSIDSRLSSSSKDGPKSPLSSTFNLDSTPNSHNIPSKPEVTKNTTSEKQESYSPVSKIISPTQSSPEMAKNGLLSPVSITNGKGPVRQESGYFSVHKSNISVEITNPTIDKINSPANSGSNSGGLLTPPLSSLAMSKSGNGVGSTSESTNNFSPKMGYVRPPPARHGSYDIPISNNESSIPNGIPLYRSSSQGKQYPSQARRVRSATTLNTSHRPNHEDIILKSKHIQPDSDNNNLAVNLPRQRATSVSHMQRSPKPKVCVYIYLFNICLKFLI